MSQLDVVLDQLRASGGKPKRVGGVWKALCPAHDDHNPSLQISEGSDGCAGVTCFAGCPTERVLDELDLEWSDLFPPKARNSMNIIAEYPYKDSAGDLLYEVVRLSPKDFRQRRPDGNGGHIWKLDGTRRVLYNLPEVEAAVAVGDWVVVVEGEKDADRLVGTGYTATTCVGGAGKWCSDYNETLRGAKVAVIPDNDDPGRAHADQVARSLHSVVGVVKVVDDLGLTDKGADASDWLAAGHDPDELLGIIERAPDWQPPADPAVDVGRIDLARIVRGEEPPTRPGLVYRADGTGLIYPGAVHDLHGEPGHGKTWFVCHVVAEALSTGAGVLALDYEGAPHTFVERLRALGVDDETIADAHRVAYHNIPGVTGDEHVDVLASEVVELSAAFVSFDAMLPALARNGLNDNDNSDVAGFYESTVRPLARAGASVITLDHLTKDTAGRVRGARGAGAKLQLVDVSYAIKLVEPFSRTKEGSFRLVCAKDRFGTFGINENVALVRVEPKDDGAHVDISIEAPDKTSAVEWNGPTFLMQQISERLEHRSLFGEGPPNWSELMDEVKGRAEWKRDALNRLVDGGWLVTKQEGRSTRYVLVNQYREGDDTPDSNGS